MTLALKVDGVAKLFGGLRAVDDVTLTIQAGERRALIGPNGAGKTTLFNLIAGALPVTLGTITLFGHDVTRAAAHRRAWLGLARTFQVSNLFPTLTVLENCLLAVQALTPARLAMHRPLRGYTALVDHDAIGLPLTAFVSIKPIDPAAPDDAPERLASLSAIEACHSVAGEESYILKVRVSSPLGLEELLQQIRAAANVSTRTTVVLSTPYEHRAPDLGGAVEMSEGSVQRVIP